MKNYLIWGIKFFTIVVCLIVIDWGVGKVADFVLKVRAEKSPSFMENILSRRDDVIIIGSSTANHTYISNEIRDSIGLSVYNAGRDGGFFVYQNCLINLILDNYSPKYILWEIGEHSLSDNFGLDREFQEETDFYPYYSNPYIKDVFDKKDKYNRLRMKSNMYKDNSNMLGDIYCLTSYFVFRTIRGEDDSEKQRLIGDNNGFVPLIEKENRELSKTTFSITQDNINDKKVDMLMATINRCRHQGVKVVFTSSPRYYESNILHTKCFVKLNEVANQEGIPYINFYTNDKIISDRRNFRDNDHLYEQGAENFMKIFISELKRVLLYY